MVCALNNMSNISNDLQGGACSTSDARWGHQMLDPVSSPRPRQGAGLGDVNHREPGYHSAETSGCFCSGWSTMNPVKLAQHPFGRRSVESSPSTWRRLTLGAGEGSDSLLSSRVQLLLGVLSASSQVLRCLPHALQHPRHSRELCAAAASPCTCCLPSCWTSSLSLEV